MWLKFILVTDNLWGLDLLTIALWMVHVFLVRLGLVLTNVVDVLVLLRDTISSTDNPIMHLHTIVT